MLQIIVIFLVLEFGRSFVRPFYARSIHQRQQTNEIRQRTASSLALLLSKTRRMASLDESVASQVIANQIDLLYDSECPICQMEVDFLKKRDTNNRIRYTDISDPSYNPKEHANIRFEDGMRKIRAVLPDGKIVTGVEVFRKTYDAIGLGWIFSLTNLPVIGKIADMAYDVWSENRLRLTGRGELADVVRERAQVSTHPHIITLTSISNLYKVEVTPINTHLIDALYPDTFSLLATCQCGSGGL